MIVSLLIYAAIAYTTYQAYRIRPFRDIKNAAKLMDTYLHESSDHTKIVLAGQRAKNYTENEGKLEDKAIWVERSMKLLVIEASLLVVIAFIQVIWL